MELKITFLDRKFQLACHDRKQATRLWGAESAKKLQQRLDDLDAAANLAMMRIAPGQWEELRRDRAGQFSARLHGGLRLIVKPEKDPPPYKPNGGLDWMAIDAIIALEVIDYHDH